MDAIFIPTENDFRRWIKEALKEYLDVYFASSNISTDEPVTYSEAEEPLLSRKEIAGLFKVSLVTLHHWMKAGIPFHKQGGRVYFFRSEVIAYLKLKQSNGKMGAHIDLNKIPDSIYRHAA